MDLVILWEEIEIYLKSAATIFTEPDANVLWLGLSKSYHAFVVQVATKNRSLKVEKIAQSKISISRKIFGLTYLNQTFA